MFDLGAILEKSNDEYIALMNKEAEMFETLDIVVIVKTDGAILN